MSDQKTTQPPGSVKQPHGRESCGPERSAGADRGISPEEMAELEELFGGRFPDDYIQPPLTPEVENWIAEHQHAR